MSRQQWPNDAEAARQMHLFRQEEKDRAPRSFNGFQESREDESCWQRLASSREPGWMPSASPLVPRRHTRPAHPLSTIHTTPPRTVHVRSFLPSPRGGERTRPVQQRASWETRECSICVEDKTLDNFTQINARCVHQANACSGCVRSWLAGTLNGMNWNGISCLSSGCTEVVQYEDMRRIETRESFQQSVSVTEI